MNFQVALTITFNTLQGHTSLKDRLLRHPSVRHADLMNMGIGWPASAHDLFLSFARLRPAEFKRHPTLLLPPLDGIQARRSIPCHDFFHLLNQQT